MTVLTYPNIEAERARRGYSKDEFSQLLGVSRKTYYNWVSKGKIPQGKLEHRAAARSIWCAAHRQAAKRPM